MFLDFLFALRLAGVPVGVGEWSVFLRGLRLGLVHDLEGVYALGRSVLCRSEADFDAYDQAFSQTFSGATLPEAAKAELDEWLKAALGPQGSMEAKRYESIEDLIRDFLERLRTQTERHDGGNTWIGTRGTSAFGNSGVAPRGIRVGGTGGGRTAIRTADERRWANYRSDRVLDVRELTVALRALRSLAREGAVSLDLDKTIEQTCRNAGDIQIVERPSRKNRLQVTLFMDAGGSMAPHAERVERLFSALQAQKTFHRLESWYFHNCVYANVYRDFQELDRVPTERVIEGLGPRHRLIFVGDASMAPYELFAAWGWTQEPSVSGLDWLKRLRARCPGSVWLNPDPPRFWNHPTVAAIGQVFPMYELTVEGLQQAVGRLRAPV